MAHAKKRAGIVPMALIGLAAISSNMAMAADLSKPGKPGAADSEQERTLQQLQSHIKALERQVKQLEERLDTVKPASAAPPASPAPASSPAGAARTATAAPRSRAGALEVDEDAARRALERTLTETGALLLPSGTVTVTPSLAYVRRESDAAPVAASIDSPPLGTFPSLVSVRNRRDELTAQIGLKVGLPYESQFEASLPYTRVWQSQVSALGPETKINGDGFGDLQLGVAKTLMRERGWRPDLIGRITYGTGTGRVSDGALLLGSGFRQWQAELVALKRQDPLAFFASAFFTKSYEDESIKPGNARGFSAGTILAASPATSLQFSYSQVFRSEQRVRGITAPGSDATYGVLNIGSSSILARNVMLIAQLGIGLGSDAPEYSFSLALPITY
jgi:hypothetical protein